MTLRRTAAIALAAALLGAGTPAHAAEGDTYAYFKWRIVKNTWQLGPADGCLNIVCPEYGYEYDPDPPHYAVPGHEYGVGYHCKYQTWVVVQNSLPEPVRPVTDPVFQAVQDLVGQAAVQAWQAYDAVTDPLPALGVDPGPRPACPGEAPLLSVPETRVSVDVLGNEVTIVIPAVSVPPGGALPHS
jgi:hypothetical protein